MNKLILFLLILLIPLAAANLGTFKQGDCVDIKTILNTSSVNISTISYPNSSLAVSNKLMTQTAQTFNYTFCKTSDFGEYIYDYFDTEGNVYVNSFYIGENLEVAQAIIFLGILCLFFLSLVGGIYGMYKSDGAWKIFYICLAYLSLFSISFISWMVSTNYLYGIPILSSIFWILWLVLGFGFLPFIIIISIYIIKKGVEENLTKDYLSQGYTKEEAFEMAKKRRR